MREDVCLKRDGDEKKMSYPRRTRPGSDSVIYLADCRLLDGNDLLLFDDTGSMPATGTDRLLLDYLRVRVGEASL